MANTTVLRSFLYLDDNIVNDYLSQLEGMLLDGSYTTKITTSSGKEGGIGVNIPSVLQGSAKANDSSLSEVERKILETPQVKFKRLYELLDDQKKIQTLNGFDESIYNQIQIGEFIEVKGNAKLPQWEDLAKAFSGISDLAEVMKALGQDPLADPQANQAFQGLTALTSMKNQEDTVLIVTPFGSPKFKFVARLDATQLKRRKEDLKSEVTLFGKVQRRLAKNETIDVFRLIPELSSLQNLSQPTNRANRRQDTKKGTATTLSPIDEIIKYPAMQIQPIAIYQL